MVDPGFVQAGVAIVAGIVTLNTFAMKAIVRFEVQKLNGRYVQTPIFASKHEALDRRLDAMQAYQVEHFRDVKDQLAVLTASMDHAGRERALVIERLARVETRREQVP
jgi:hypothetical protein